MPERSRVTLPRRRSKLSSRAIVAGGMVGCLAAGWLGIVAGRPFVIAGRMRAENDRIERRNEEMRYETQTLRKQAEAVRTDAGMEREARRLGYVRKGELPMVIPQ